MERLNCTLCQMPSYLVAEQRRKLDDMLAYDVAAQSAHAAGGITLTPDEVHMNRYPRMPMII